MSSQPGTPGAGQKLQPLFPLDLPTRKWVEFSAHGYSSPVSGAIFTADEHPCCGVPLGGISTGCLDLDPRGVFGYSSIFNPGSEHPEWKNWWYPRRFPTPQPFLGLAVNGKTWVLADASMASGEAIEWCTEPQQQIKEDGIHLTPAVHVPTPKIEGVSFAKRIAYWGHYPAADMEFETDAPLSVGLRAWSPFIPGDLAASNTPAAVFEVYVRNPGPASQQGTLAFSFAGPDLLEARSPDFSRTAVHETVHGMLVSSQGGVQYLLGAAGEANARFGTNLNRSGGAWAQIASELPQSPSRLAGGAPLYQDGSCSAAVDFELAPGAEKVVRFVLAWFAPLVEGAKKSWKGDAEFTPNAGFMNIRWIGSEWEGNIHYYTQMYASRFSSALDVARSVAANGPTLYRRVLAWQAAVYTDASLPVWLRDALVNNLCLLAEDSYWFQPKAPLGEWAFPLGVFALNESTRGCPHTSCIPCDWYGNLPVVYFFPELARLTLRAFMQYQKADGEIPFAIGKIAELPDMATPEYYWQVSLNGMCYVDMVDRLWQRTGDDAILREFYASVKRCNTFTMNLRQGPGGPISMPTIGGMEWFEFGEWAGMATHMGGLRLAELRMAERMAQAMGDHEYVQQCQAWYADGTRAMEDEMWNGTYYLNYYEKETGKRSDDVMGYQLDGEWTARYHGLPGVFRADRVLTTLDTINKSNIALAPEVGAVNFARPEGAPLDPKSKVAHYGRFTMFTPEMVVLSMTYIYAGKKTFGLELARKFWENMCLKQGLAWDTPNMVHGDSGIRVFGTDYSQNMMLWAMPAAAAGQDLRGSCAPGGLIDRVIQAGKS